MTLKTLAAASCLSMAITTSTFAAPITLDFEFEGVTGTFYGLDDADGKSSATSFDLHYGRVASWTNVSTSGASGNDFRFSSGRIKSFYFQFWNIGIPNDTLLGTQQSWDVLDRLYFSDSRALAYFSDDPNFWWLYGQLNDVYDSGLYGVTYTINPVAAVPLPAGGLLLLTGIGGVAALKRRKKRAA